MAVSEEQVKRKNYSIISAQENMLDGTNLKSQIQLLREKVLELEEYWNTEASEIEIAKYKAIVQDLQSITPPVRIIEALKGEIPNAAKIIKSSTYF